MMKENITPKNFLSSSKFQFSISWTDSFKFQSITCVSRQLLEPDILFILNHFHDTFILVGDQGDYMERLIGGANQRAFHVVRGA